MLGGDQTLQYGILETYVQYIRLIIMPIDTFQTCELFCYSNCLQLTVNIHAAVRKNAAKNPNILQSSVHYF